ncbi:MAG: (2Fe-2S) ferredoxin domain-containing protein [Candidatus Thioglobus sp.]|nr:(2Fe-2S) ferredoxin domain-containing protein [Candidatus Thioglobus pontius]MBL6976949.1 (2Fe-2S) ferredoxin domain-containing protein [Candidatus Thioglobus sp.]MBL6984643.1 (2Fe-2S) ferredoxin domain-containing protein [Candidatus Thioglobus sp.]
MNYYTRHIFFCNNQRKDGKPCCSQLGAKAMYRYAKDKCRDARQMGEGKIGISESRCLGRCEHGPVAVVYPDNVWYQYIDEEDIDEIITEHLIGGNSVKRLQID